MNASPRTGAGQHLPRLVFWEVTKGCNLRCVHCRATATELASPNDLPTAQCLNIIDQIAAFANPILVLSGGEPLYRPDIFQLAKYATDKGLRVALATNGTLVTKEVAQTDRRRRRQARLASRWTAPMPTPTTASAEFPAPSTPPSTASGISKSWACRCRST